MSAPHLQSGWTESNHVEPLGCRCHHLDASLEYVILLSLHGELQTINRHSSQGATTSCTDFLRTAPPLVDHGAPPPPYLQVSRVGQWDPTPCSSPPGFRNGNPLQPGNHSHGAWASMLCSSSKASGLPAKGKAFIQVTKYKEFLCDRAPVNSSPLRF